MGGMEIWDYDNGFVLEPCDHQIDFQVNEYSHKIERVVITYASDWENPFLEKEEKTFGSKAHLDLELITKDFQGRNLILRMDDRMMDFFLSMMHQDDE